MGLSESQKNGLSNGFTGIEGFENTTRWDGWAFSHGVQPGLADACLVPQVANAERNKVDLSAFPTVLKVVEACNALPAFEKALPANQPDAP